MSLLFFFIIIFAMLADGPSLFLQTAYLPSMWAGLRQHAHPLFISCGSARTADPSISRCFLGSSIRRTPFPPLLQDLQPTETTLTAAFSCRLQLF